MQPVLYRQLADHYLSAIASGALAEGDRMPSVRALMRTHSVSLSTALQACRHLEGEGWLEARPRSGYFVRRRQRRAALPPATEPSAERPVDAAAYVGIHAKVSGIVARGQQLPVHANLALAVGAPALYPSEAMQRLATRVLRRRPALLGTMARPAGDPALKAMVARRLVAQGVPAAPDDVVVTHGCIEALNIALRAVAQPGDTIAVESPTYYGLLQILESLGLRALEIPTSPHTGISLEALDFALSSQADAQAPGAIKAVACMPNLHNPLGCVMPDDHKERLVRLCERHGVALIEDDIYAPLHDAGGEQPLKPCKAWDTRGQVIFCHSLNKALAPGLRLGWMLPGRWQARVEMLKFAQVRYTEELPQLVAAEYLAGGALERHLQRFRLALRAQREQTAEAVAQSFPAGTRLSLPPGGLLLWVELPPAVNADALFEQALQQGIKVAPGSMFSNGPRFDHFLRLSCGAPFGADTAQALARLGEIAQRLAVAGGR